MVKTAIVDDTDPNIVYSSGWITLGKTYSDTTNEFNSTLHYSSTSGVTIRYSFRGTGITVYGTLPKPTTLGTPNSTYTIDNASPFLFNSTGQIGNRDFTLSHIPLFQSPVLSYGDHTLVINVDNVDDAAERRYFFDFFTVDGVQDDDNAQGTGSSSVGPGYTIVDDRDSRITYSGSQWSTIASGTGSDYQRTTTTTPSGVNGIASMTFTGTDVAVYGRLYGNYGTQTIAQVVVDAGTADQVTKSTTSYASIVTERRHQPMIMISGLKEGQHTVQLTSFGQSAPIWYLDYLVYGTTRTGSGSMNGPIVAGDSGDGGNEGSVVMTTTTFTSNGVLVTATKPVTLMSVGLPSGDDYSNNGTNPNSSSGSTGRSRSPAIVGGTIAFVAVVAIVLFMVLYWLRRRKMLKTRAEVGGEYERYRDFEGDEMTVGGGSGSGGGNGGSGGGPRIRENANQMASTGAILSDSGSGDRGRGDIELELSNWRPPRLPPARGEKSRHLQPDVRFSDENEVTQMRNSAQMTTVHSFVTSEQPTTIVATSEEPQTPASSFVPQSRSFVPPHLQSTRDLAVAGRSNDAVLVVGGESGEGNGWRERLLLSRVEEDPSSGAGAGAGDVVKANRLYGTNYQAGIQDYSFLPSNQQEQQPQAPFMRQGEGGAQSPSVTRSANTSEIGREMDAGIRLDPMQFNLTAPDLLPPSYAATTTYRR